MADAAKRDLTAFFNSLDLSRPEAARDALLQLLPAVTERYGNVAATLAANFYDELRAEARVAGRFSAPMAANVDPDAPTGTVRRLAGYLFTDSPTAMLPGLLLAASKYVLQPGRTTIVQAAHADPRRPRYARVPGGPDPCAFCQVMASRGFKYASAQSAGEENDYHGDCHCTVVADWDDHPSLDGYDPTGLYDKYEAAAHQAGTGQLNDILVAYREMHGVS